MKELVFLLIFISYSTLVYSNAKVESVLPKGCYTKILSHFINQNDALADQVYGVNHKEILRRSIVKSRKQMTKYGKRRIENVNRLVNHLLKTTNITKERADLLRGRNIFPEISKSKIIFKLFQAETRAQKKIKGVNAIDQIIEFDSFSPKEQSDIVVGLTRRMFFTFNENVTRKNLNELKDMREIFGLSRESYNNFLNTWKEVKEIEPSLIMHFVRDELEALKDTEYFKKLISKKKEKKVLFDRLKEMLKAKKEKIKLQNIKVVNVDRSVVPTIEEIATNKGKRIVGEKIKKDFLDDVTESGRLFFIYENLSFLNNNQIDDIISSKYFKELPGSIKLALKQRSDQIENYLELKSVISKSKKQLKEIEQTKIKTENLGTEKVSKETLDNITRQMETILKFDNEKQVIESINKLFSTYAGRLDENAFKEVASNAIYICKHFDNAEDVIIMFESIVTNAKSVPLKTKTIEELKESMIKLTNEMTKISNRKISHDIINSNWTSTLESPEAVKLANDLKLQIKTYENHLVSIYGDSGNNPANQLVIGEQIEAPSLKLLEIPKKARQKKVPKKIKSVIDSSPRPKGALSDDEIDSILIQMKVMGANAESIDKLFSSNVGKLDDYAFKKLAMGVLNIADKISNFGEVVKIHENIARHAKTVKLKLATINELKDLMAKTAKRHSTFPGRRQRFNEVIKSKWITSPNKIDEAPLSGNELQPKLIAPKAKPKKEITTRSGQIENLPVNINSDLALPKITTKELIVVLEEMHIIKHYELKSEAKAIERVFQRYSGRLDNESFIQIAKKAIEIADYIDIKGGQTNIYQSIATHARLANISTETRLKLKATMRKSASKLFFWWKTKKAEKIIDSDWNVLKNDYDNLSANQLVIEDHSKAIKIKGLEINHSTTPTIDEIATNKAKRVIAKKGLLDKATDSERLAFINENLLFLNLKQIDEISTSKYFDNFADNIQQAIRQRSNQLHSYLTQKTALSQTIEDLQLLEYGERVYKNSRTKKMQKYESKHLLLKMDGFHKSNTPEKTIDFVDKIFSTYLGKLDDDAFESFAHRAIKFSKSFTEDDKKIAMLKIVVTNAKSTILELEIVKYLKISMLKIANKIKDPANQKVLTDIINSEWNTLSLSPREAKKLRKNLNIKKEIYEKQMLDIYDNGNSPANQMIIKDHSQAPI